jgi:hypothetical protein
MARMLSITRSASLEPGIRKRNLSGGSNGFRVGPMTLSVVTVGLIGFMTLFYVVQASVGANESFQVHTLEQRSEELKDDNRRLEVEASKLRALDSLERELKDERSSYQTARPVASVQLPADDVAVQAR